MTRRFTATLFAFSLIGTFGAASAQDSGVPVPTEDDSIDRARQALQQQEEDVDEEDYLEQVLSASDRNYSLVPKGSLDVFYMFNYDYVSSDRLEIDFDEERGEFTRFDVERDAEHSIRNTITLDYGIRDNLSLGLVVPIVTKYNTLDSREVTTLGDLRVRGRWQPREVRPGRTTITLFGDATLPTGRSPYEIDLDDELSTGGGLWGLSTGATFSRVVDPVVAFGSVSFDYNLSESGLDQVRNGRLLREVDPGNAFSFSLGMAYALSYDVSMTFQYQQTFSGRTTFVFDDVVRESAYQNAGIFSISTGWRISPEVIMNVTVGVGQTGDSPDIVLGVSLPITYDGLASIF